MKTNQEPTLQWFAKADWAVCLLVKTSQEDPLQRKISAELTFWGLLLDIGACQVPVHQGRLPTGEVTHNALYKDTEIMHPVPLYWFSSDLHLTIWPNHQPTKQIQGKHKFKRLTSPLPSCYPEYSAKCCSFPNKCTLYGWYIFLQKCLDHLLFLNPERVEQQLWHWILHHFQRHMNLIWDFFLEAKKGKLVTNGIPADSTPPPTNSAQMRLNINMTLNFFPSYFVEKHWLIMDWGGLSFQWPISSCLSSGVLVCFSTVLPPPPPSPSHILLYMFLLVVAWGWGYLMLPITGERRVEVWAPHVTLPSGVPLLNFCRARTFEIYAASGRDTG